MTVMAQLLMQSFWENVDFDKNIINFCNGGDRKQGNVPEESFT